MVIPIPVSQHATVPREYVVGLPRPNTARHNQNTQPTQVLLVVVMLVVVGVVVVVAIVVVVPVLVAVVTVVVGVVIVVMVTVVIGIVGPLTKFTTIASNTFYIHNGGSCGGARKAPGMQQ